MRALTFLTATAMLVASFAAPPAGAAETKPELQAAARPAPAPLTLRRAVSIEDDVIRLGDLFDNAGDRAEVTVSYAPRPGRSAVFDAERLYEIARVQRLRWRPRGRFERIVITRASQVIDADTIAAEVQSIARADGLGDDIRVTLDSRVGPIHLPTGIPRTLAVKDFRLDRRVGRFTAVLHAPADAPVVVSRISGRIDRVVRVPVLKRSLRKKEIIGKDDIDWLEMRVTRIGQNVVTDAADLVGKATRRTLRPNRPIREIDIREPIVVVKGSYVIMVYRTKAMTLTARGRALQNGAKGAVIRLQNVHSKRTIEAKVIDPETVLILARRPLALSN